MSKAFVETTILTNILLKESQDEGKAALAELGRFDVTELPVYAIKEFTAGPLHNYVYVHNKLVDTKSYPATLKAVSKIIAYQPRKASTALEALVESESSIEKKIPGGLQIKYGDKATSDSIHCDESRLILNYLIKKAWKRRRSVTSSVVNELSCYEETAPEEIANGSIKLKNKKCKKECSMADALRKEPEVLTKLRDSIDPSSNRKEDTKRREALKLLLKHPKHEMTDDLCRNLGDAVFSFFAPPDSTIITTNLRDHVPLANAIGKQAKAPDLP